MTGFRMRLPATSANLGSGFDAAAIALNFHLDIEAEAAAEFTIHATGQDAQLCSRLHGNLIVDCYRKILADHGSSAPPLAIRMHNEIPLGMGCGSSAAGRLAAAAHVRARAGAGGPGLRRALRAARYARRRGQPRIDQRPR